MICGIKYMQGKHINPMNPYLVIYNPLLWNITTSHTPSSQFPPQKIKIISKHRIFKYWSSHNRETSSEITDMSVFQHAKTNPPIWQRQWMPKWSCDMCGVGKWLKCWKEQKHYKWHRCLKDNKTVNQNIHYMRQEAALFCSTGLEDIKEWIIRQYSYPVLSLAISVRLLHQRNKEELHSIQRLSWNIQA